MKLMIVDGNSILNRAYYGVKPLSNHKGVFTNAVYGFFNILLKAMDDTKADHVIIAFDRKEKTFRNCSMTWPNGWAVILRARWPCTATTRAGVRSPSVSTTNDKWKTSSTI